MWLMGVLRWIASDQVGIYHHLCDIYQVFCELGASKFVIVNDRRTCDECYRAAHHGRSMGGDFRFLMIKDE